MPNIINNPSFFPRRLSQYVPAMRYSSDVNYNGGTRVSFGAPALASATAILSASSLATAISVPAASMVLSVIPETYGRTLSYIASGASTATITTDGWDYLGQPVTETITLNGAVAVPGIKAFKYIRQITNTVTAATTMNVGTGARLGLPYVSIRCQFETANGVLAAAGTLVAPVLTDPATALTGDPRGLYTPTTTLNGTTVITAVFDCYNDVNANNNGGLHGIAHFAA